MNEADKVLAGQAAATGGDMSYDGAALDSVTAETITLNGGSIKQANAVTINLNDGGIAQAQAGTINVNDGGIAMAKGDQITVSGGGVAAVIAQHAEVNGGSVAFLAAGEVSGDATILIDRARRPSSGWCSGWSWASSSSWQAARERDSSGRRPEHRGVLSPTEPAALAGAPTEPVWELVS